MYGTFRQIPTFAKLLFCPFFKIFLPCILPSVLFWGGSNFLKTHVRKHSNVALNLEIRSHKNRPAVYISDGIK